MNENPCSGKIRISKSEIRNPKQILMTKQRNLKRYELEERTEAFARRTRALVKKLKKSRANYSEANEALSKKDFCMRIKMCRKESKESRYWLRLVDTEEQGVLNK